MWRMIDRVMRRFRSFTALLSVLATALPALVAPLGSAAAAPAAPAPEERVRLAAVGGPVRMAEVPLGRQRLTARLRSTTYRMVAVTWRGADPTVQVRTRGVRSGWSGWRELETLEDGPSVGSPEGNGRRGTGLAWVGRSDGVQVRAAGDRYDDLELVLLDPGRLPTDTEEPALARTTASASGPSADTAPAPRLRSRAAWGADESWRSGEPRYNWTIQQVHVHHTASSNRYSRADVPGIIRGMYRYHTRSLGWSDLGYNFVVDKFARTWIGRAGGAWKPVRGAHTLGFNHTSVGVAVLGSFQSTNPTWDAQSELVRLAAWKLDRYDRRPSGWITVYSQGSDKYPRGTRPRLRVIDGHRDTNDTACPGWRLYDRLDSIRSRTQKRTDWFS